MSGKYKIGDIDTIKFVSKYENGVYTINLTGGESGDGLEIYTVYKQGSKYLNFGKLSVASYAEQTYKVGIVPVNDTPIDIEAIRRTLKDIYGPVGIAWDVSEEKGYSYFGENKFFEKNSGLLNSYTETMRAMNADFADNFKNGAVDPQTNYVFILKYSGGTMKRDAAGFMPRGGQFGYIFTKDFQNDDEILQTIAHELGHGKLLLKHTFDKDYGIAQGTTDNLMDYAQSKTHLAKWQWDVLADPGIAQGVFDRDEDGMVAVTDYDDTVAVVWRTIVTPQQFKNKKHWFYNRIGKMQGKDPTQSVFYGMTNGAVIREYDEVKMYYETEVNRVYEMLLPGYKENEELRSPFRFFPDQYEDDCLSCGLEFIAQRIEEFAGRYVLPLENIVILVDGENFDGNESSRIAAGGFLILELVQAGKIYKLVKGARIFTRMGRGINVTRRVMWTAGKEITREAVIDISAQFVVNFVDAAVANPDVDAWDITTKAFSGIKVGSALWSGLINYTTLSVKEQFAFDCAYRVLKRFEKNEDILVGLKDGGVDCLFLFGIRYALSRLQNTEAVKQLTKALNDTKQYDIIMQKLDKIMTSENMNSFIEVLVENGINKARE